MSMFDGISQCWPLAKDCAVWWEAWAVLTGGLVGLASTAVAILAWRTSGRAAEIAAEAKDIARQQHLEAVRLREANARIIGFLLAHEIGELPVNLFTLRESCKRVLQKGKPADEADVNYLESVVSRGAVSYLPGTEKSVDRLHNLPEDLGNDLAVLVGYNRTLNAMSADILKMIRVIERPYTNPPTIKVFTGNMSVIESFLKYVELFSRQSMPAAGRIRDFIGEEPYDLSAYDVDKIA